MFNTAQALQNSIGNGRAAFGGGAARYQSALAVKLMRIDSEFRCCHHPPPCVARLKTKRENADVQPLALSPAFTSTPKTRDKQNTHRSALFDSYVGLH
jgi:hypothetical protein